MAEYKVGTNTCEHGDHPAPDGKRFCSDDCKRCETAECRDDEECAGLCERPESELPKLLAVAAKARALTAAADACEREAQNHASSRSSAPMVRYINAMAGLREALRALDAKGSDHG